MKSQVNQTDQATQAVTCIQHPFCRGMKREKTAMRFARFASLKWQAYSFPLLLFLPLLLSSLPQLSNFLSLTYPPPCGLQSSSRGQYPDSRSLALPCGQQLPRAVEATIVGFGSRVVNTDSLSSALPCGYQLPRAVEATRWVSVALDLAGCGSWLVAGSGCLVGTIPTHGHRHYLVGINRLGLSKRLVGFGCRVALNHGHRHYLVGINCLGLSKRLVIQWPWTVCWIVTFLFCTALWWVRQRTNISQYCMHPMYMTCQLPSGGLVATVLLDANADHWEHFWGLVFCILSWSRLVFCYFIYHVLRPKSFDLWGRCWLVSFQV